MKIQRFMVGIRMEANYETMIKKGEPGKRLFLPLRCRRREPIAAAASSEWITHTTA
jgi:hypothetical protein